MAESDDSEEQDKQLMRQARYLSHKSEVIIDDWREFGNMGAIKDDLNLFIITTHAAIEDATTHVITRYVIDDRLSEDAYNYVYSNMSQSHREQLLTECGILSESTRGKFGHFRGLRNAVAHEPFVQLNWREQNIEDKIQGATTALERLTWGALDEDRMNEVIQKGNDKI